METMDNRDNEKDNPIRDEEVLFFAVRSTSNALPLAARRICGPRYEVGTHVFAAARSARLAQKAKKQLRSTTCAEKRSGLIEV